MTDQNQNYHAMLSAMRKAKRAERAPRTIRSSAPTKPTSRELWAAVFKKINAENAATSKS